MSSTVLATFDEVEDARRAVHDLTEVGFNRSDIGLAVYDSSNEYVTELDEDVTGAEGAGFGATVGTVFGAMVGLAAITIPGIGPVIAAGPLAAALGAATGAGIGAVSGAITGGITASLVNMGVPEEEAHYYAESLRRGAALVSVTTTEVNVDRVKHILRNHNPIDIDQRITQWRAKGWSGFDPSVEGYRPEKLSNQHNYDDVVPEPYDEEAYPHREDDEEYMGGIRHYRR